jgi:hypothetical protein
LYGWFESKKSFAAPSLPGQFARFPQTPRSVRNDATSVQHAHG